MEDKELERYEQWTDLANAIVAQAAKDYMEYKQKLHKIKLGLRKYKDDVEKNHAVNQYKGRLGDIVRFFKSKRYKEFTSVDPQVILNGLNREFEIWKDKYEAKLAKKNQTNLDLKHPDAGDNKT